MKHMKKVLSMLLIMCMILGMIPMSASATGDDANDDSSQVAKTSLTMGTKPANGTTEGNPFVQGTAGSNSFRIPAMVTLNDGTIVAAADARWNTTYDGGGLDTIVSYSKDNGANWNYTFANYLGDNGNEYNGSDSTAFIDPALATDGSTVYMLVDLYPYGVALNGSGNTAPSTEVGFNSDGTLKLAANGSSTYNYYLKDGQIYDSSNNVVSGYTVDAYFNITGNGYDTNLFFSDSPYQVVRTGYLYLTKSTDGGKTWSEPTLIPNVKTSSEQVCLVGPGRGLVTGGKIIFPVYSYNNGTQYTSFIYSEDSGVTWKRSLNATSSMWSSEAAVVELKDGTLRFFYRNGQSKLYYVDYNTSTSSWGTPVDSGIATNSNTQISAIKYSKTVGGKEVILVSCPTGRDSSGSANSSASERLNGKIFVGYVNSDNTMSWQSDKAVSVTSNNSQFMYSCLTELSDGKVAILYENQESKWGTGDNCYYTMNFQTYDLGLTVDSGNTGTENGSTITDGTTQTVVTAPSDIDLTSIKVKTATVDGITGKDYVAYDITLNDGAYTGSADVSIALPDKMINLSESQLTGFTVETDGSLTFKKGTLKDGVYTFTAPHFSVQGVLSLADITDTQDVELSVGESKEFTDNSGNYSSNYTNPDATIATMKVEGKDGQKGGVKYTEASVTCNTLISRDKSNWSSVSGYYYTPDGVNYYPVYAKRSSSWRWSSLAYTYTYDWGYSTTSSSSNVTPIDTQSTTDTSTTPNITVYTSSTTPAVDPSTIITFKGVATGETTAIVGKTQYNIIVKRKTETVSISVGGTATYADSTADSGITNSDSTVVKTEYANEKVTFTGLKDGKATVTTAGVVYNVTVNDGTSISIKENETTTLSVNLENGQTVTWSSSDNNYVGVAGKYDTSAGAYTNEAILAGQKVTESPVTVIGTIKDADGNVVRTVKWLVTVTEGDADTNTSSKGIYFNIDTIENCTVYYSINGGELIPVNGTGVTTGNWTENGTFNGHFNIMFFAAPDEGYALTYMSISGSADQYYTLSNGNPDGTGSDAWPFKDANASTIPSGSNDSAWKTVNGSLHGFRWALLEGNMTIDQMKVMFSNAIALGCDGATTITKNSTDGMGSASSPTVCKFVAQKLPTVEKTIKSITHNGTETTYTDGMKVEIGDTINYSVVVTRYATNATYGTITYDNEKLTDELTNNQGISNPDMGTSTTTDKTYTYQTLLKLTMDNYADVVKDGKITNTVDFSYSYSSEYSAGSLTSEASAIADITVSIPEYVIDFGLPVSIDLSSKLGSAEILSGTAKYGEITANGTSFTYTPNTTLKDNDHVTLTLKNGKSYGVRIIPATTVYYEENLANLNGFSLNGEAKNATQATQIAGSSSDEYGFDSSYADDVAGASNGTCAISVKKADTAQFDFAGTGVDIYVNSKEATGNIAIQVKETSTNKLVKVATVQTTSNSTIAEKFSNSDEANLIAASITGLTYGDYTVKITNISADGTEVIFDGFRVYGTLKDQKNSVYVADLEDDPSYIELRDYVLTGLSVDNSKSSAEVYAQIREKTTGELTSVVLTKNNAYDGEALLENGPKNELFLLPGESVAFSINTKREVQIGLKAPVAATSYQIKEGAEKTISTSTDMFYTIAPKQQNEEKQTFTIENTGESLLSVTKIKVCDDPNATLSELTEADIETALNYLNEEDTPAEPEVTYADATLNITVNDQSTVLTKNGVVGENAVFTAAEVEEAVNALVADGYELTDATYSDVEVAYGESDSLSFTATEKPSESEEGNNNNIISIINKIWNAIKNIFSKR
ncbi:sialidase family protein [Bariatricus sp. SGI.161]|uniref:sialidase family protein n=1 Tax=Bariatricus sp. SGI.161 TaxID=3420550 RepID=UPI003CFDFA26